MLSNDKIGFLLLKQYYLIEKELAVLTHITDQIYSLSQL